MRKLLFILMLLAGRAWSFPDYVDITTHTTAPISSGGGVAMLSLTNLTVLTNSSGAILGIIGKYTATNTLGLFIGDTFPVGMAKLNGDVLYLSTAVRTNGNTGQGQIPMTTNNTASGVAWVPMPTGGGTGGGATNLTPWPSDIDASLHSLTNLNALTFQSSQGTINNLQFLNTSNPVVSGYGMFISGITNRVLSNTPDQPVLLIGGVFNYVNGSDGSMTIGGSFNTISGSGGIPSLGSFIIGGISNKIGPVASGHIDRSMILNGSEFWLQNAGVTAIGDRYGYAEFIVAVDDMLAIRETNGVGINTNDARPFALSVSGDVNFSGSPFNNGVIVPAIGYTNTALSAGKLNGGGIGTNRPMDITNNGGYFGRLVGYGLGTNAPPDLRVSVATNDPAGNPLASLLAATNAVTGAIYSLAWLNYYAFGTNETAIGISTNFSGSQYRTNGTVITLTFSNVVTVPFYTAPNSVIFLMGAGDANWNGFYGINVASTPEANAVGWTNFNGLNYEGGLIQLTNPAILQPAGWYAGVNSDQYNSTNSAPFNWQLEPGTVSSNNSPPIGAYVTLVSYSWVTNIWYVVYDTRNTTFTPDLSGSQMALTVQSKLNAGFYFANGLTLQSVIQGWIWPNLYVTNCAGVATNFNGIFDNTYLGYYTNETSGVKLAAPGFFGQIDGTNFQTSSGLLFSNTASIFGQDSFYQNPTNVLGLYTLVPGHNRMPTNQPLVSVYYKGITATLANWTNSLGTHGFTETFQNGLLVATNNF